MTKADFFRICAEYLDHEALVPHEPWPMALAASDVGESEN